MARKKAEPAKAGRRTIQSQGFVELELDRICPNPWNPRRRFSGERFEELVESIRKVGVLEPILVRPFPDGPRLVDTPSWPNHGRMVDFEVVAGERRFRARHQVAGENGGVAGASIPAIVRVLSDDEAFEVMTIENIQREDLTELEEARNFQLYLDRKGPEAVEDLALRTGISPAYIRRRVRVLALPQDVLSAWEEGRLKYGHLEQLSRLKGEKEIVETAARVLRERFGDGPMSVRELKHEIDCQAPKLAAAPWDLGEEGCLACAHNSDVQKQLFAVEETEKTTCASPKCFKQKLNNYLLANWKTSAIRKACKTNGFRFYDTVSYHDFEIFGTGSNSPFTKCRLCERLATLIDADGDVRIKRACLDPKCLKALRKEKEKDSRKLSNGEMAAAAEGGEAPQAEAPRVAWHGEHFRELFFKEKIRAWFELALQEPTAGYEIPPLLADPRILRILLFGLLRHVRALDPWFARAHGLTNRNGECPEGCDWFLSDPDQQRAAVFGMEPTKAADALARAACEMILAAEVAPAHRRAAGELLGIDLASEWRITEEYLAKKTIGEMLAFGGKLGIFDDPQALVFLRETLKRRAFTVLKKAELARVFLESGAELAGKVPEEILGT